jgi:glucose-6-phosphate 1-dehydrogenase
MAELVPVEPFDIVVFGATGDLARRKLLPALFHRWCDGQIPGSSRIIAVARDALTDAQFAALAAEFALNNGPSPDRQARWKDFIRHVQYIGVEAEGEGPGWHALKAQLDACPDKIRSSIWPCRPRSTARSAKRSASMG